MKIKPRLSARGMVLPTFVLLIIMDFLVFHASTPIEYWLQDMLVRVHSTGKTPDPNVAVVNVDERSLYKMTKEVGGWLWPQAVYGQLVQGIQAEQPYIYKVTSVRSS